MHTTGLLSGAKGLGSFMANNDFAEVRNRSILAREMWAAWQSEIDALHEREKKLREYVEHKPDCELVLYCASCSSHQDIHPPPPSQAGHYFRSMAKADPEQPGCTCGLAELLAAKEGS